MKTFGEWYMEEGHKYGMRQGEEIVWNAAREGMIPADRAIKIPNEKLWPKDAECIEIRYLRANGDHIKQVAPNVLRSKPMWVPNVTDTVFILIGDLVCVGVVFSITWLIGVPSFTVNSGGMIHQCGIEYLRRFSGNKAHLKWDEL